MLSTKIKDYQIQSELGRGGMATVYMAHDNKFDTNVAIKVLNKEFVHNDNIRKRFLAEARNMFKMSHPNIIKVTDLIDDGDTVAFVMEYIEGETLKEYLERKGKLNDEEIKLIFPQMLEAVGYVHEQNLVHRDIKPSNFMLDKDGKVKLIDFGIAVETCYKATDIAGTLLYMSPEQLNASKLEIQSDIYTLGILLYEMITAKKPSHIKEAYEKELDLNTQTSAVNAPGSSNYKIFPVELTNTFWDEIIQKATQFKIDKRYRNCLEFLQFFCSISEVEQKMEEISTEKISIIDNNKPRDTITQFDNYAIVYELGRGGMAVVYLAHDLKFDTQVAVKVLNKEYVNNDNIRKRFLAEARNMYRMSHPNIIKVTDLIDEGDTVAFVMEYIEGETLKEYLERKGKLKDDEIKTIFSQMLDAVGYVHTQNLVHRDIKPSNFMIDKKGKIKLMDFGIAKNMDPNSAEYTMTEQHQIMGTVMYMSPEQVKSTKEVTISADIYSLGVVFWQMVAGRKPYDTNELSVPEIQVNILKEPLPSLNTVWDKIIQKATQKNLDNRFNNCEDFKSVVTNANSNQDQTIITVNNEIPITNIKKIENYSNALLAFQIESAAAHETVLPIPTPAAGVDVDAMAKSLGITVIRMPLLSDTMTEGKIVAWNKKVGDTIKSDDYLADVETDKVTLELVSNAEGTLLYKGVEAGMAVKVNEVIAIVGKPGIDINVYLETIQNRVNTTVHESPTFDSALIGGITKNNQNKTIIVDNQERTIVESLKINDNYENTEAANLHIDFFFPLKVKDCFTKIYNELQAELKYGIDWDVPLTQIDSYNWYYPETMPDDFGIIGFSKNNLDFYFAYYSLYNSRPVDDCDFVFCSELRWVPFSDIYSIEDKDKIDAVLNDNVLLKFTLEFILRVKKTDYYTKINDYKKFLKNNKLEFGAPKYFSTQWFNATDAITRSLIKWDVSTKPWDDVSEWQSHIAFQFQEYFFCIGRYPKLGWAISVHSKKDLKIYSLISLVKDNMNVFTNTYSLPKEVTEFIFNMIRMWVNLFEITDKKNKTAVSSGIKNPTEYFTSIYSLLADEVKRQIKWNVSDFPWIVENEMDSIICFEINSLQFSFGQGFDGYCITGFNPKNNELYSAHVFYPYLEKFIIEFNLTSQLKHFILKLCDVNAAAYAFSATAASKNDLYALFNKLQEKHQLKTGSKFYIGTDIPEKKKLNYLNKIKIDYGNINFSEFILLYDDTVFGKCDEGIGIVLSEELKLLLLIIEGKKTIVATINYNSPFLPRISEFRANYGKFSREIILEFYSANSISVDCGIKHFAVNIDSFINELILKLR